MSDLYSRCDESRLFELDGDRSRDSIAYDDIHLVQRGVNSQETSNRHSTVTYAVAPVRKGDTLMTLALRYGCKVAHLKQLNRMYGDQEVFGVRTIRVPVKRHGIVEELIQEEQTAEELEQNYIGSKGTAELSDYEDLSDSDSDAAVSGSSNKMIDVGQRRPLLRRISTGDSVNASGHQTLEFLHAIDKDVNSIMSAVAAVRTSNDTIDASVTCRRQRHDSLKTWGFDCGVRWSTAVAIMIVVGVAIPIVVIVYYYFKQKAEVTFSTGSTLKP